MGFRYTINAKTGEPVFVDDEDFLTLEQWREIEEVWKRFWLPVLADDRGTKRDLINVERLKRELFDYHTFMHEVAKVYDEITCGRVSKVNTLADAVLGEVHACREEQERDLENET